MDAMEAILTRRSIRHYTDQPIAEAVMEQLLRAAMHAPSAGNGQPWHFVVLRQRALLDAIPQFHPHAAMLRHAPAAILVCGDERLEKYPNRWMQDCSAAMQNLLLAAHALGLGAVWVGIQPDEERVAAVRQLLHLPVEVHPLALAALGYPAETPKVVERFKPERIHFDGWS